MKIGLSLTCAMLLALAVQSVYGAEPAKATTDELPAALKALNADSAKALTTNEASTIRGESWGVNEWVNLGPMINGFGIQNFGGNVEIIGKNISIGSKNKFSFKSHGHHHHH